MKANKGKIMEISDSHAVVLNREGQFVRIKRKESMRIGGEILYTSSDLVKKTSFTKGWIFNLKAQVAVAMLILVVLVASQITTPVAYAVVSLDINPSLEITVNDSRKVVSINPINTEADELLEAYVLNESKDLHAVINELIELAGTMGYLTNENHNVILAAAMMDNNISKEDSMRFISDLVSSIEETEYTFDFTLISTEREAEEVKNAKSEGLSLGRYAMTKENFVPPGQEKKLEEIAETEPKEITLPPGQEKKLEESAEAEPDEIALPPGQVKNDKEKPVPPGQELKEKNTPSKFVITEKKAPSTPPGQTKDKGNSNSNGGNNKGGGKGN